MAVTAQIAPAVVTTTEENSAWSWSSADVATLSTVDSVAATHQTQNRANFPSFSVTDWLVIQPDLTALAAAIPSGNDPVGLQIAMENMATNSKFIEGKIREITDNDPGGPLHHGVQFSKDSGATWHDLAVDARIYTQSPGNLDLMHGGATDLGGVTLSRTELLSGTFRYRVMASGVDSGSPVHQVDHIALIVHHEAAGGGGGTGSATLTAGGASVSATGASGNTGAASLTAGGGSVAATGASSAAGGSITAGGYLSFGTNQGSVFNVDRATQVAALPVSWTVDSGSGFDIEARVIAEVGGATVVDWTTVATNVTADGTANLSLPQTTNTRNQVQLRVVGEAAIETASGRVGAGLVWVAYGQSQIANRNTTFAENPDPANVGLLKFADAVTTTGTWVDAERATCAGIGLHVTDRPVAVIAAAVASQSIEQLTTGVIFDRMVAAINSLGGSAVIELEQMTANLGDDAATSEAAHLAFVQAVRAGCTGTVEFVFSLGSNHPAVARSSTQGVAAGKKAVIDSEADVFLGPHAYDLDTSDNVHWTTASYNISARRAGLAAAWRTGILGERNGPEMVSATASGNTVVITVANDPGSVLDTSIDTYAMRVFNSGASSVSIQSASVTSNTEITLTVASSAAGGTVEFGYMLDNKTTYIFDDAGMPLQITTPGAEIAISAGAGGTGSATLTAGGASIAGTGASANTGAGTLSAGGASVAGAGASNNTGSATLTAGGGSIAGTGGGGQIGVAALTAGGASVAATGASANAGAATLTSGGASVEGAGASSNTGAADLTAGGASVSGSGVSGSAAAATLTAGGASISGAGQSANTGSAAITAGGATIAGAGASDTDWIITGPAPAWGGVGLPFEDAEPGGVALVRTSARRFYVPAESRRAVVRPDKVA